MRKARDVKFGMLPETKNLLFLLSKKHDCSKSEMVRRMIHEKANEELSQSELDKIKKMEV